MIEAMSSVLHIPDRRKSGASLSLPPSLSLSLSLSFSLPVNIMKGLIPVVECCVQLYGPTTCGRYLSQPVMYFQQYSLSIFTSVLFCLYTSPLVCRWCVVESACAMWDLFVSSFFRSATKAFPLSNWKVIGQPYRDIQYVIK